MAEGAKRVQPPELSQVGKGAWDGLPGGNSFEIEVIKEMESNGGTARNTGEISIHRTSEDH